MWQSILDFFTLVGNRVVSVQFIIDIIDIAIVAFLVYKTLQFAVQTRAEQLLKGVAIVVILYSIANWLNMVALSFIMSAVLQVGVVILVVLFQPEIRRALEQIGRSNVVGGSLKLLNKGTAAGTSENERFRTALDAVGRAVTEFSLHSTGALIVFEKETKLGEVISTGTVLNADISTELIETLFFPNTALHDGAVILAGSKVRAAGCFLPLTQNFEISKELGTRHRAALGLSEVSDAVIIVVSEETGKISLVENGQMLRGLNVEEMKRRLYESLKKADSTATRKRKSGRAGGSKDE